jgi:hypothetical protein
MLRRRLGMPAGIAGIPWQRFGFPKPGPPADSSSAETILGLVRGGPTRSAEGNQRDRSGRPDEGGGAIPFCGA